MLHSLLRDAFCLFCRVNKESYKSSHVCVSVCECVVTERQACSDQLLSW